MRAALVVLTALLVVGCTGQPRTEPTSAADPVAACIALCQEALTEDRDLSSGPCLSDSVVPDWVCDVAHSPRDPIDNLIENQCAAFRSGAAHHFVEVDQHCALIQKW